MAKAEEDSTLVAAMLGIAFCAFFVIFVDAASGVGQHLWLKAFGEQTEGRVIGASSSTKKGRKGKTYKVSVYRYAFEDSQGRTYEDVTGQKSFLFGEGGSVSSWAPGTYARAPRVSVLYLPGDPQVSWVEAYEQDLGGSIFLTVLMLFLLALTGGGTITLLKRDSLPTTSSKPSRSGGAMPQPHSPRRASPSQPSQGRGKKRGKRRRK